MLDEVYATVAKCKSCLQNGNEHLRWLRMKFFQAIGAPEFVAMDILEALPKTTQGNHFFLVITQRYSKLTRSITTFKGTSAHRTNLFLDDWIYKFGISMDLLADNGQQFVSKFFRCVSGRGLKLLTTTGPRGLFPYSSGPFRVNISQILKQNKIPWPKMTVTIINNP